MPHNHKCSLCKERSAIIRVGKTAYLCEPCGHEIAETVRRQGLPAVEEVPRNSRRLYVSTKAYLVSEALATVIRKSTGEMVTWSEVARSGMAWGLRTAMEAESAKDLNLHEQLASDGSGPDKQQEPCESPPCEQEAA